MEFHKDSKHRCRGFGEWRPRQKQNHLGSVGGTVENWGKRKSVEMKLEQGGAYLQGGSWRFRDGREPLSEESQGNGLGRLDHSQNRKMRGIWDKPGFEKKKGSREVRF